MNNCVFLILNHVVMSIEEIREYCIAKKGVTEGLSFNDTALVFKVVGKMFALADLFGNASEERIKDWIDCSCDDSAGTEEGGIGRGWNPGRIERKSRSVLLRLQI
jgi:hypothetical protein